MSAVSTCHLRNNPLAEELKLSALVRDRPDHHVLHASVLEGREALHERSRWPDGKSVAQNVLGAVDRTQHPSSEDPVGV